MVEVVVIVLRDTLQGGRRRHTREMDDLLCHAGRV